MNRLPFTLSRQVHSRFVKHYWGLLALGGLLSVAAILVGTQLLAPLGSVSSSPVASDAMSSLGDTSGGESRPAGALGPGWQPVLGVAAAIVLVLGLLYGTLLALRNLMQPGSPTRAGTKLLRLQTTLRLGRDQALYLVRCGQEELLIGASPAGLVLLARQPQCEPMHATEFDHLLTSAVEERPL